MALTTVSLASIRSRAIVNLLISRGTQIVRRTGLGLRSLLDLDFLIFNLMTDTNASIFAAFNSLDNSSDDLNDNENKPGEDVNSH